MSSPHVTLDEPLFLFLVPKVMIVVSALLNSVAVYLIVTRSSEMKTYRWFVLNYVVGLRCSGRFQLTSFIFDVYMAILMGPVPLFPYMAGHTSGILTHFGITTHAQMV